MLTILALVLVFAVPLILEALPEEWTEGHRTYPYWSDGK